MLNVAFTQRAIMEIDAFIHSYEEAFFSLYRDSGLLAEDPIVEIYHNTALELQRNIMFGIRERLRVRKVLGRKVFGEYCQVLLHVGDRLVIVDYTENLKNNLRRVLTVSIDRKPIIF